MAAEHSVGFEPADRLAEDHESVRRGFWRKLKQVAARLPFAEDLLAAYYCAFDKDTPRHVQVALMGAIAYFILPFDFVPDMMPVLGFTDDAAVLAAYNWAPNTERYRKLALFVDNFFTKFPTFQNPPFHPKWKEVSLSAPLQDWQRLPSAEQWLKAHNVEAVRSRFDDFLKQSPATAANMKTDTDKEALFKQFQAWEAEKNARAQVRPAR